MIYNTLVEIKLVPVYWQDPPTIKLGINNNLEYYTLEKETQFSYNMDLRAGDAQLVLEFFGKTNSDTTLTNDKAVIIEEIKLNQIADPKFIWIGQYTPVYPEPWASAQLDLKPTLTNVNYLGWNGTWIMNFTIPVFTWIHQTRNLGWLYN